MSKTKKIVYAVAMGLWVVGCGGSSSGNSPGAEEPEAVEATSEVEATDETAGGESSEFAGDPVNCSPEFYQKVEDTLHISDADGHGPDVGSEEWMTAVEMRMSNQVSLNMPTQGTAPWCRRVDEFMRSTPSDYE